MLYSLVHDFSSRTAVVRIEKYLLTCIGYVLNIWTFIIKLYCKTFSVLSF